MSLQTSIPFPFEPGLLTEINQIGQLRTIEAGTVLMKPGLPMLYIPGSFVR